MSKSSVHPKQPCMLTSPPPKIPGSQVRGQHSTSASGSRIPGTPRTNPYWGLPTQGNPHTRSHAKTANQSSKSTVAPHVGENVKRQLPVRSKIEDVEHIRSPNKTKKRTKHITKYA